MNPDGADGLLYGNAAQMFPQVVGVLTSIAVSVVMTFLILKAISLVTPLRVPEETEKAGLDLALHGEAAYMKF